VRAPAGGALLVAPAVTVRGYPRPLTATGGALVADPAQGATTRAFAPGAATTLASADGRVSVDLPGAAASQGLTLRHDAAPPAGEAAAPPIAGSKRGFGAFYLSATDGGGAAVHRFAQPLTIAHRYTPEQLRARGIAEPDLTLFAYDPAATVTLPNGVVQRGRWVALPTRVDTAAHTATATVDHFSAFQLGDGSSASGAYVPSLKGGQVDLFTGRATYDLPIEVPAGPGGARPALTLAYDSGQTDGPAGRNEKHQAGWAGKGWSLDTGSVALDKTPDGGTLTYTLILGGKRFTLVRPERPDPPPTGQLDRWDWRTSDEGYTKIRAVALPALAGRGGGDSGTASYQRYGWRIWAKDGTRYEFDDDLWWGWDDCDPGQFNPPTAYMEPYRWSLTRVVDPRGNAITYTYFHDTQSPGTTSCNGMSGTVDNVSYPYSITWGANDTVAGSQDHFRVAFNVGDPRWRQWDTAHDGAANQYGGPEVGAPHETRFLDDIHVDSAPDGASWRLIRQYNLLYDQTLVADAPNSGYTKLSLRSVDRVGSDGLAALPRIAFGYGPGPGGGTRLADGANRLATVDNGQGGVLTFAYRNIANAANDDIFDNFQRVTTTTATDRGAPLGQWHYDYANPELNSLGSQLAGGDNDPQQYPNAATLYLNAYYGAPAPDRLVVAKHSELRGHRTVTVTDPGGNATVHWFYQGDEAGCAPGATGGAIFGDSCFQRLRDAEIRAGREYRTEVHAGDANAPLLTRAERTLSVLFDKYSIDAVPGVWHWTVSHDATTATAFEGGGGAGLGRITTYAYDGYHNPIAIREYNGPDPNTAPLLRRTQRDYATSNTVDSGGSTYIVDRLAQSQVFDGAGALVARAQAFYDGQGYLGLGARGEQTKTSAFFDLAGAQSSDATYGYDAYGNRTQATTYTGPNGGGAARTTATAYDPTFHDRPTAVTPPLAALAEQATYDPVTRWMLTATDPNGQATLARYDLFGRIVALARPGDTLDAPTVGTSYYNYQDLGAGQPAAAFVALWDSPTAGHWAMRFWDGTGRTIQTKRQSGAAGDQTRVADTVYDDAHNRVSAYQPRYMAETPSDTFFRYDPLGTSQTPLYAATTTTDALGRATLVAAPDGTTTRAAYTLGGLGVVATTTDANGHVAGRETDLFGRLRTVTEETGTSPNVAPGGVTRYAYDVLDRLTTTTDAQNNQATLAYDALGRKTASGDPDLGNWTYRYDAAGNLTQQTDAKGQVTGFGYDALDRLVAESGAVTATYTYDQGAFGLGRRTGAANPAATSSAAYDARGRTIATSGTVQGVTAAFQYEYDRQDRPTATTYPTGERAATAYDPADRPLSLCTSAGGCYANGAQYTALDQPTSTTLGSGLLEQRGYVAPMQRLQRLQVGASVQSPSTVSDRSYTYDGVGNVAQISDSLQTVDQRFTYDERDRLTRACVASRVPSSPCGDIEADSYDAIGNLTSKNGVAYVYTSGDTTSGHAHAPASVGGGAYSYDANGNTLSGGGRSYTWDARNLPTGIAGTGGAPPPGGGAPNLTAPSRGGAGSGSPGNAAPSRGGPTVAGVPANAAAVRPTATGGGTEAYTYDAGGQRVTRTANGITTVYFGGLFEQDVESGVTRSQYAFAGHTIAQKTVAGGSATLVYLHGDHLGSVSVATSATGAVLDRQEYGPWGNVRGGNVSETTLNYTGQKRDGTGLLYYGARYYDPALGRFLSPDTMGVSLGNPQTLNRYSYVTNNPMNRTDPTGHCGGGGPEGNDCASEPTAGGGDRGSDQRAAENGGGDGGGSNHEAVYHEAATPGSNPIGNVLCSAGGGCTTNPFPGTGAGIACAGCTTNPFPGLGSGIVCAGCTTNPFPGTGAGIACAGCATNPFPGLNGGILGTPPQPTQGGILASGPPVNANGEPYPTVLDPEGNPVPYHGGVPGERVPGDQRTPRDQAAIERYKAEWESQHGGQPPPGGFWNGETGDWQIHHIVPIAYGGDNSYSNLVPVQRGPDHQALTNWWNI